MPGIVQEQQQQQPRLSLEQFAQWKALREQEKQQEVKRLAEQRVVDIKSGRIPLDELTGRELAEHHPEVFQGY
jgi:hypothetical protein